MGLLHAGIGEEQQLYAEWKRCGIATDFFPIDRLVSTLKQEIAPALLAEGIVCFVQLMLDLPPPFVRTTPAKGGFDAIGLGTAFKLIAELRALPRWVSMCDGRTWNSVPVILVHPHCIQDHQIAGSTRVHAIPYAIDRNEVVSAVKKVITDYRMSILDQFENLGFLVTYDHGRYRVGPALNRKDLDGGDLFFAPDIARTNRLVTIHRDARGIEQDIEEFESLLNDPTVTEPKIQLYLEEHPTFLDPWLNWQALPHIQLKKTDDKVLIPDFVQRPNVARYRDLNWRVLDLKRPQAKLLSGPSRRLQFSSEVSKAIRQLRDYAEYFRDPANEIHVVKLLGYKLRGPRLAVLIGRTPRDLVDTDALNQEQSRHSDVQIISYDEILEQQATLLDSQT